MFRCASVVHRLWGVAASAIADVRQQCHRHMADQANQAADLPVAVAEFMNPFGAVARVGN